MSVKRCQQEVDAREFVEWEAMYALDPWDDGRADWRAAMIAATIANSQRGRGTRAYTVQDFLPRFGPPVPQREQTPEEMLQIFRQITEASGHRGQF